MVPTWKRLGLCALQSAALHCHSNVVSVTVANAAADAVTWARSRGEQRARVWVPAWLAPNLHPAPPCTALQDWRGHAAAPGGLL